MTRGVVYCSPTIIISDPDLGSCTHKVVVMDARLMHSSAIEMIS